VATDRIAATEQRHWAAFATLPEVSTMNPELFGYLAAALTSLSFLPQAVMTIRTRDTHSLSLGMYSLFSTGVLFWLLYGIHLHDAAIIVANAITLALATPILLIKLRNEMRRKAFAKRHD
jgi:MtN3 and saliva related transmembrane protein